MIYFTNDYGDIAYPYLLDALKNCLDEKNEGYGFDRHSAAAAELIKGKINCDADIHFVTGGTAANILCTTAGLRPEESIIAATTGHIWGHEAGAIEATGKKIELIHSYDGKLSAEMVSEKMAKFGPEFMTVPKMVYISNTTELGTVYSRDELDSLYKACRELGLYLYIDGARAAAAMAVKSARLTLETLPEVCDIFTLGGTKNGMPFGEAVVIVNDELKRGFLNLQKQKGAMMAKTFVLGIMFEALFQGDRYISGAEKAQEKAEKLACALKQKGVEFTYKFESNQIFVLLDKTLADRLKKEIGFEVVGELKGKLISRFVTNYRTSDDDIRGLVDII